MSKAILGSFGGSKYIPVLGLLSTVSLLKYTYNRSKLNESDQIQIITQRVMRFMNLKPLIPNIFHKKSRLYPKANRNLWNNYTGFEFDSTLYSLVYREVQILWFMKESEFRGARMQIYGKLFSRNPLKITYINIENPKYKEEDYYQIIESQIKFAQESQDLIWKIILQHLGRNFDKFKESTDELANYIPNIELDLAEEEKVFYSKVKKFWRRVDDAFE